MSHRVVLVREWDAQMSSSGCCGRLGGITHELGEPGTYAHVRTGMEAMGAVYRALRQEWSREQVDITVVDPRNMVWMIPAVWRDARRQGLSRRQAWRQLLCLSPNTVVVDGQVLFTGTAPHPVEALAVVRTALADE